MKEELRRAAYALILTITYGLITAFLFALFIYGGHEIRIWSGLPDGYLFQYYGFIFEAFFKYGYYLGTLVCALALVVTAFGNWAHGYRLIYRLTLVWIFLPPAIFGDAFLFSIFSTSEFSSKLIEYQFLQELVFYYIAFLFSFFITDTPKHFSFAQLRGSFKLGPKERRQPFGGFMVLLITGLLGLPGFLVGILSRSWEAENFYSYYETTLPVIGAIWTAFGVVLDGAAAEVLRLAAGLHSSLKDIDAVDGDKVTKIEQKVTLVANMTQSFALLLRAASRYSVGGLLCVLLGYSIAVGKIIF